MSLENKLSIEMIYRNIEKGKYSKAPLNKNYLSFNLPSFRVYQVYDKSIRDLKVIPPGIVSKVINNIAQTLKYQESRVSVENLNNPEIVKQIKIKTYKAIKQYYTNLKDDIVIELLSDADSRVNLFEDAKSLLEQTGKLTDTLIKSLESEEDDEGGVAGLMHYDESVNERDFSYSLEVKKLILSSGKVVTIDEENDLYVVLVPDKDKIYSGLVRASANTSSQSERLSKLVSFATFDDDSDSKIFIVDKILGDFFVGGEKPTYNGYELDTVEDLKRKIIYTVGPGKFGFNLEKFSSTNFEALSNLRLILDSYDLHERKMAIVELTLKDSNVSTRVIDSNQSNGEKLLMNSWINAFNLKKFGFKSEELVDNFLDDLSNVNSSLATLSNILDLKLSSALLGEFDEVASKSFNSLRGLSIHDSNTVLTIKDKIRALSFLARQRKEGTFQNYIEKVPDLFEESADSSENEGFKSLFREIAKLQLRFDESILENSFQTFERKTVYGYQWGSNTHQFIQSLKNEEFIEKTKLGNPYSGQQYSPDSYTFARNPLLEKLHADISGSLKDKISFISPDAVKLEVSGNKSDSTGLSFSDFGSKELIVYALGLFSSSLNKKSDSFMSYIPLGQNEASKLMEFVNIPLMTNIYDLFSSSANYTSNLSEILYLARVEKERILKATDLLQRFAVYKGIAKGSSFKVNGKELQEFVKNEQIKALRQISYYNRNELVDNEQEILIHKEFSDGTIVADNEVYVYYTTAFNQKSPLLEYANNPDNKNNVFNFDTFPNNNGARVFKQDKFDELFKELINKANANPNKIYYFPLLKSNTLVATVKFTDFVNKVPSNILLPEEYESKVGDRVEPKVVEQSLVSFGKTPDVVKTNIVSTKPKVQASSLDWEKDSNIDTIIKDNYGDNISNSELNKLKETLDFDKLQDVYEGYHTGTVKLDESGFVDVKESNVKALKISQNVSDIITYEDLALHDKNLDSDFTDKSKLRIRSKVMKFADNQLSKLESLGIVSFNTSGSINYEKSLIPKELITNSRNITKQRLTDKQIVKASLVQLWLGSTLLNLARTGDVLLNYKNDDSDPFKRNKMDAEAGLSIYSELSGDYYGVKPIKELTYLIETEPTAKSDIDDSDLKIADAQARCSVDFHLKQDFGFNKISRKKFEIFKRFHEGIEAEDELEQMKELDYYLNVKKTVVANGNNKQKFSMATLNKPQTAYKETITLEEYFKHAYIEFTEIGKKINSVKEYEEFYNNPDNANLKGLTRQRVGSKVEVSWNLESSDSEFYKWTVRPGSNNEKLHHKRMVLDGWRFTNNEWVYTGNKIDYILPPTASKAATKNLVHDFKNIDDNYHIGKTDAKGYKLQVENPAGKKEIYDPTQTLEIIFNELDKGITIRDSKDGSLVSLTQKEAQELLSNLLADRLDFNYSIAKSVVVDEKDQLKLDFLISKMNESLQDSGGDVQLLEFTKEAVNGNFRANPNLPIYKDKVMSMWFKHFTTNVTKAKVNGDALVMIAPDGFSIMKKVVTKTVKYKSADNKQTLEKQIKTWEVIPRDSSEYFEALKQQNIKDFTDLKYDIRNTLYGNGTKDALTNTLSSMEDGEYFTDSPRHNVIEISKNGELSLYHSESLIPKWDDRANTKQSLNFMHGVRIPTQDKQSMVNIKWVDYLPTGLANSIVVPKEIAQIAGSDFDVDKIYVHRLSGYFVGKEFFPYTGDSKSFRRFMINENTDINDLIKKELGDNIQYINNELRFNLLKLNLKFLINQQNKILQGKQVEKKTYREAAKQYYEAIKELIIIYKSEKELIKSYFDYFRERTKIDSTRNVNSGYGIYIKKNDIKEEGYEDYKPIVNYGNFLVNLIMKELDNINQFEDSGLLDIYKLFKKEGFYTQKIRELKGENYFRYLIQEVLFKVLNKIEAQIKIEKAEEILVNSKFLLDIEENESIKLEELTDDIIRNIEEIEYLEETLRNQELRILKKKLSNIRYKKNGEYIYAGYINNKILEFKMGSVSSNCSMLSEGERGIYDTHVSLDSIIDIDKRFFLVKKKEFLSSNSYSQILVNNESEESYDFRDISTSEEIINRLKEVFLGKYKSINSKALRNKLESLNFVEQRINTIISEINLAYIEYPFLDKNKNSLIDKKDKNPLFSIVRMGEYQEAVQIGKSAIGIAVNATHIGVVARRLNSFITKSLAPIYFSEILINEGVYKTLKEVRAISFTGNRTFSYMSTNISITTDEAKEGQLARYNIDESALQVISAMLLYGFDLGHCVTLVNSPSVLAYKKELKSSELKTKEELSQFKTSVNKIKAKYFSEDTIGDINKGVKPINVQNFNLYNKINVAYYEFFTRLYKSTFKLNSVVKGKKGFEKDINSLIETIETNESLSDPFSIVDHSGALLDPYYNKVISVNKEVLRLSDKLFSNNSINFKRIQETIKKTVLSNTHEFRKKSTSKTDEILLNNELFKITNINHPLHVSKLSYDLISGNNTIVKRILTTIKDKYPEVFDLISTELEFKIAPSKITSDRYTIDILSIKDKGRLNPTKQTNLIVMFRSLFGHGSEEVRELGLDIFRYFLVVDAGQFGPNSLSKIIPFEVYKLLSDVFDRGTAVKYNSNSFIINNSLLRFFRNVYNKKYLLSRKKYEEINVFFTNANLEGQLTKIQNLNIFQLTSSHDIVEESYPMAFVIDNRLYTRFKSNLTNKIYYIPDVFRGASNVKSSYINDTYINFYETITEKDNSSNLDKTLDDYNSIISDNTIIDSELKRHINSNFLSLQTGKEKSQNLKFAKDVFYVAKSIIDSKSNVE